MVPGKLICNAPLSRAGMLIPAAEPWYMPPSAGHPAVPGILAGCEVARDMPAGPHAKAEKRKGPIIMRMYTSIVAEDRIRIVLFRPRPGS